MVDVSGRYLCRHDVLPRAFQRVIGHRVIASILARRQGRHLDLAQLGDSLSEVLPSLVW